MKTSIRQTITEYWKSCRRYRPAVFVTAVAAVSATVIDNIAPLFYKRFFDVLTTTSDRESVLPHLVGILIFIFFLHFIVWLCWRTATFVASYFQSSIMRDLSNRCYEYLQGHSFAFFNNSFVGSLVKKIKWFTNAFEDVSDRVLWNMLPLVVNIVTVVTILWFRNIFLGLGMLTWIIIFLLVNWLFTRYKFKYDLARSETETKTTGFLADTITNHVTVKLFNGLSRELRSFSGLTEELRRLRKFTWDLSNVFEAIQALLMISLEFGMFYLAVQLWRQGILTIGDFVLIQAYLITIFLRIWDFGRTIRAVYERLADAAEMTEILTTPHEITDVRGAKPLVVTAGSIEFKKVDFFYHKTRKVLKDFSLLVKSHEHIALIGPSGAGKTTAVKLLLRMHDIAAGKILIDNQNIAHVTQESLWKNISLVPQDPVLFHRSLMENIRYGKPNATYEEVIAASQAANCHQFISEFADGYDTYVGERGVKLSGGERQRVSIARAILRNAPILVLDEATSSLDSESEMLIQQALDNLIAGKTVIIIAHRLSTIRKMDRIVVIDNGQVVEEGDHELLSKKKNGLYQRLWKLQAGGFIQ